MPDREVQTVKDLIYYQYSKLICRSAFKIPDGVQAKGKHYGFIKNTFRDLKSGYKNWSDIIREDLQFVEVEKKCIYCGSEETVTREHIVPKSLFIKNECTTCDRIQSIHNLIWACRSCNSSKGTIGLYEFYKLKYPDENKFYDLIHPLAEKKYLKTMYYCHECAGTLNSEDPNHDGKIDVLDIDYILH
ncbi:hypothetical protein BMS3Abin03_02053 [bacterium BMS3Abin03]|nr:hypothetical protein BMS3Abin03_02053 [bacterium BMS3Abin03]